MHPPKHAALGIRAVHDQISARILRFEQDLARYPGHLDAQHLTQELVRHLKDHMAELDSHITALESENA